MGFSGTVILTGLQGQGSQEDEVKLSEVRVS